MVIADYDAFVDTGEKYENTAGIITELLSQFIQSADSLNETVNTMADGIVAISDSIHESSSAISMSAHNSAEIVEDFQGIGAAVLENNKVTNQLSCNIEKFETV